MKKYPTQKRLKELFNYNIKSGFVTRIKSASNNAQKGSVLNTRNNKGYISVRVDYVTYSLHRLIFIYMGHGIELKYVDHINHNKLDNSWSNLRLTCAKGNGRNQSKSKSNSSGFTGVCWHKASRKWDVSARINGKLIHFGLYNCFIDAISERIRVNNTFDFHINHGK